MTDDTTVAACQHEGHGAYCHKCGVLRPGKTRDEKPGCDAKAHGHMREKHSRNFCTFCGKNLQE